MAGFYAQPGQLMHWMIYEMRWTYNFNQQNEMFSFAIRPAIQTMNDSIVEQSSSSTSFDAIKLSFDIRTIEQTSQKIKEENATPTYLIRDVLTLMINDLMLLFKQELPILFEQCQIKFLQYTIKFDPHLGKCKSD